MLNSTREIRDVVAATWSDMFGIEARDRTEAIPTADRQHYLSAFVNITGNWVGTVVIEYSPGMARCLTARTYRCEPSEVDFDQMRDVLGEVSNIVAGQLKKGLPDGCYLSLPSIVAGLDYQLIVPNAKVVDRVSFETDADAFQVTLLHIDQPQREFGSPGYLLGGRHGTPYEHRS